MRYSARDLTVGGLFGALGVALPVLFHLVGLGKTFLPMHLPVLVCGLIVAPPVAFAVGVVTPLVSSALTGMPPLYPPVAAVVALAGAALGGAASLLYRRGAGRLWPALIAAVCCGRLTALGASWVLARWFGLPAALASAAVLLQGLPGVVLQLAVAPIVVRALAKRGGPLFGQND